MGTEISVCSQNILTRVIDSLSDTVYVFFTTFSPKNIYCLQQKQMPQNFRVSNLPMIYLIYFSVVSGEKLGRSMSNKLLIFNYYGNSRWRHTKANIEIYSKAVGISINKTYTNKNWRHQIGWNWAVFFFI